MIDPLDPDVEAIPMSNALHAALSDIWPDLTKADWQRVAEAVTQEQAAVIRELRAERDEARAEVDRLREALKHLVTALDNVAFVIPRQYGTATLNDAMHRARAALDAEEDS